MQDHSSAAIELVIRKSRCCFVPPLSVLLGPSSLACMAERACRGADASSGILLKTSPFFVSTETEMGTCDEQGASITSRSSTGSLPALHAWLSEHVRESAEGWDKAAGAFTYHKLNSGRRVILH